MKVKLLAVLIVVSALFIGAVLWRTDSFVYGDRMSWVEAQTRTQLGSMNHSLAVELKSLQRVVSTFSPDSFKKDHFNWTAVAPYYAVASFVVSNSGELDPQTLLTKENSKAANWNKEFLKSALGSVTERTTDLRYFVKPFQDNNRGRYVAIVFLEGGKAYALIGSGEIFQSLIDSQRGSLGSLSIVTSKGLTVGHSVPEYLGTVMKDDPVFKETQKSATPHGSGIFKTAGDQEIYGMYEEVPQSNLLVLSSAPVTDTMRGRRGLWWQFLLLGCGLVLVGIAGALWVISPVEREIESLEQQLQNAKARVVTVPEVPKTVIADPEMVAKDKVQTSMRVASALAHEMSGPLTSILGYSQMILAKNPDGEIVASTDSILRETRAARAVLDKLLGYAGEEIKDKNSMKVEGPLARALKNLDSLLQSKGVRVVKSIQDTSAIDVHPDALSKAFENILTNSIEAMERMSKKEIKVDLFEDEQAIHLTIEDSGEGIEPQNLQRIFDPFFTTRSFHNHMGLGLSVSFGVLKEHNAELQVSSERGKGTRVHILFKKQASVAVLKAPEKEEPVEEIVIARELPTLKPESEQRVEAEEQFAAIQAEQIPETPESPLDVNIDKLLELPAMPDIKLSPEAALAPLPPKIPTVTLKEALQGKQFDDDKTQLIDLAETAPAGAELAPADDMIPPGLINAPNMIAKEKISKLDSYRVEIRKPGKRI